MYGRGAGPLVVPVVASVATAAVLPSTGNSSLIITLAAAVAAGMLTWGVLYARNSR